MTVKDGFTKQSLQHTVPLILKKMEASADELNRLDGILGDGDLGVTLLRGFRGIDDELAGLPADVGMALSVIAQALIKVSGSTFGTLLATGLLRAAKSTRGRSAVPWSEIPELMSQALDAMRQRGKSELGDKTVLDAIDAIRKALQSIDDPRRMIVAANLAQEEALTEFRTRQSKQGRARIFGEKSIGMNDPGMMAIKLMTEALVGDNC